jgi:hypothetical protein
MNNSNLDISNEEYILEYFSSPYNVLMYTTICSIIHEIETQETSAFQENNDLPIIYSVGNNSDYEDINNYDMNNLLYNDTSSRHLVTSSDVLSKIEIISLPDNTEKVCPITLEKFTNKSKITKLPCGHIFSFEAIYKWLSKKSNKCPCCRHEYKSVNR